MADYIIKKALKWFNKYIGRGSMQIIWTVALWALDFLAEYIDEIEAMAKKTKNKTDDKIVDAIKRLIAIL